MVPGMGLRFTTHPAMAFHDPGKDHPEAPERLRALLSGLAPAVDIVDRLATRGELALVHAPEYVDRVLSMSCGGELDHETRLSSGSVEAACRAAGVVLEAVDRLQRAGAGSAFALVRPPGHHATANAGMGFCIFNNVVIGVRRAQTLGSRRTLVIDWDAHHGNGTQSLLERDEASFLIDVHQEDCFPPGSGRADERGVGVGRGHVVNVPVPAESSNGEFLHVFDRIVLPAMRVIRPDFVVVSAGFDGHRSDSEACLALDADGFAAMTARVADECAPIQAPLLFVLEGGYDSSHLTECVRRCGEAIDGRAAARIMRSPSCTFVERTEELARDALALLESAVKREPLHA